jgi:hypothetical protein
MLSNTLKSFLIKSGLAASALLLAGGAYAQQQISLTAGPTTLTMPDGTVVPMWGYSCGAAVTGSTATCTKSNPAAAGWSPVVITIPTGQDLQVNLTNSLSFAQIGSTTATNGVPTSLMIIGQLGGGLGTTATSTAAPDHSNSQPLTWPVAGTTPGTAAPVGVGTPPVQGTRVQSFSTEVLAGATASVCWGTGCPTATPALRPGTYLIESGTHPSIQGPMGLYGVLVVTTAPVTTGTAARGIAYSTPLVNYDAEVPLVLSEIDPVQNAAVNAAVTNAKFSETMVWSGLPGGCGNPNTPATSATPFGACYPPAVNYTPLYYLINGVAFNKTSAATSLFPALPGTSATPVTGNVLVRFVNAGLRMHVPSIVGSQIGTAVAPAVPPSGFTLIAEDGNPLPGIARVQSEVFLAAGKTYDVMINVPAATTTALPVYDRELSLSSNATARDAGMLAYIGVNGSALPTALTSAATSAIATPDIYNSVVSCTAAPCRQVIVSDPSKGLIANDFNIFGVKVSTAPTKGTLVLNTDGTFTYTPNVGTGSDSFTYCGNGTTSGAACASVTLGAAPIEAASGITVNPITYTSTVATSLSIKTPGILSVDSDSAGYPLTVVGATATTPLVATLTGPGAGTATVDSTGAFNASVSVPGTYTFTYKAQNSQGTPSATAATVTLIFPAPSGLVVKVFDGTDKVTPITDYRWIIEEDRTFYVDPTKTTNGCTPVPPATTCTTTGTTIVPTFGTNFHTSFMPVVATGCVGPITGAKSCESGQSILGTAAVCDIGDGVCRTTATQQTPVDPSQVALDPTKRYYLSILPGDAANPSTAAANGGTAVGHGMGGAPIAAACTPVPPATTCTGTLAPLTVYSQPTPFPPSKLAIFVFEDDFPLNGEHDGGGGIDVLSPNEPGLGQFAVVIMDDAGGPGDATGQVDYDMFNQPLTNSLDGTVDPATGLNACPITQVGVNYPGTNAANGPATLDSNGNAIPSQTAGITGVIVTCPKYEAGTDSAGNPILSPLAGQIVVANMMPGRYGVIARPGADRIARGEEWLQTNTLDGQKAHDSFLRIGEPAFFQEFGPSGYHVSIGFANPAVINSRLAGVCLGTDVNITGSNCNNTITGKVTTERMSRTPDERLYSSGSRNSFAFTQCYVSFGDPDGEDFAFTKCAADGTFTLSGLPDGDWRVTTFDEWNDQLVDGLSTPVRLAGGATVPLEIAANQWQANFYARTFFDTNGDGVSNKDSAGNATEPGLALVKTNVRFRDGSFSNRSSTDLNGFVAFNEEFPLFNWYVIETDVTRYKNTGTHVVYDSGGPADGSASCGTGAANSFPKCNASAVISANLANTVELYNLPRTLRVPGAVYCAQPDCIGASIATGPVVGGTSGPGVVSTGRIDPPWVLTEGWQGFSGQNSFLEFGKKPYAAGENGGIRGHVVYSSTRPFDDPQFGTQNVWEPLVPGVTINLYQEMTAPDGSQSLKLVDTTTTSSWDKWAQGFRSDGVPNMNCPGQSTSDLFYFSLFNQPNYLDVYNSQHGGPAPTPLPNNSQFKCYDGMHNWNQLQPAPYDGMYQFPSVTGMNPVSGKPTGTNCTACVPNPDTTDPYRRGLPMLPRGKYVVEVVVPPGYELVKEEDKNILIGDTFIAPAAVEFPGLGSAIYIMPDQAQVAASYNANNAQNLTNSLGRAQNLTSHEGDTPTVDTFWPCVGATRIVPDYLSLFPLAQQVSPFAGATRNLCDRKEVTLDDQTSSQAEFFVFTSTQAASHFAGVITDDFTSEFDPFSPQFGEKFAPPDLPVAIKDWTGTEIARVYSDHWGTYNGMTYSSWEVNPPNPTGFSPTMMVTCMNDPGTGPTPDPLYNPAYSNFCYEIPFMPGATQYMDTPVTPTSAFAGAGYNNPDCAYPDATPAISEVDGDGVGPWVSAAGNTLTIHALGDQLVNNNAYSGPQATTAPYNQKKITRHYNFGASGTVALLDASGVSHPLTNVSWSPTTITGAVPTGMPNCPIQQQAQYAGATATATQCGQLVITAANGKQSIDTVTVTIGGKPPTHVLASGTIQSAIDLAAPGDLIIIDPTCNTAAAGVVGCTTAGATKTSSTHTEMLLMWKPVRLQGVGAASSIINANTHPAGVLVAWRQKVDCLFGMALNGTPLSSTNPYDPNGVATCGGTGMNYFTPFDKVTSVNPQVDRLPLEAAVGWDATLNGNLAELLQEPTLMGALEGAAITVLSKGVNFPSNPFTADTFPTGTRLLTAGSCGANTATATNPFPSNFWCNPSSIDGLGITNSSQGGGGIFVHAWGHNLQIANNRIFNNSGTLSGGINVGQGEFPPQYLGGAGAVNADPGSCESSNVTNVQLPYCHNLNVNVHHNAVMLNTSTGDELFSATPAGAGGVSFCTGADYYKFQYNWVCGNLSTGDGGGIGHLGFSKNGDIEHNTVLFNQSTNPTIATNGGGILIMGAPDIDPPCSALTDADCLSAPNLIGPSDGSGPGLVINANLIMGNAAESGSGGGIQLQNVNGSEVVNFPNMPSRWNSISITNNIIANNVAGWDGAGISLLDALNVNIVNNTIMSNDTTASSGVLFNTFGAPLASTHGPTCTANCGTASAPQPAGLVAIQNSAVLDANLPATITCPAGHGGTGSSPTSGTCRKYSYPLLANDIFWQNRSFYIGVGALSAQFQQNVVTLYNAFTGAPGTPAPSQPQADATTANGGGTIITGGTGACTAASYWDIGVRGDTGPSNHAAGLLAPTYSVITDAGDYPGLHNTGSNPTAVSQYCNGSRVPPEFASMGYQVPPGISDATVPNPIFSLTPAATVDEGNNWVNISWGPLATTNPVSGTTLGNYALAAGSPAIDYIPTTSNTYALAPHTDFFGNLRPETAGAPIDVGAVEYQVAGAPAPTLASIAPNTGVRGAAVPVTLTGTNLTGATAVTVSGTGVACTIVAPTPTATTVNANCAITATAALTARTVSVTTPGGTSNTVTFTLQGATLSSIAPTSGFRGTTVAVTLTGTNLTGATAVNLGGGVTCTGITSTATTVTANCAITAGAALSTRSVTAATPAGTANGVTFTVQSAVTVTPLTITLPVGTSTGTGTVTFTNNATAGGASVLVSSVAVTGGTALTWFFSKDTTAGADTCTGVSVAPGASCTYGVRFTNVGATRPGAHTGNISFTDNAPASPQNATLRGVAN